MRYLHAIMCTLAFASCVDAQDGKTFTNSLGMTFARIEAGTFLMGAGDAPPKSRAEWLERDHDEAPAHRVTISRPFYLGIHEVTNGQYEVFHAAHKDLRGKRNGPAKDDDPVAFVAWQDAVAFCAWLSKKEGKTYRLPTEAEWEYACRAGTTTKYHTGDVLAPEDANFSKAADARARRVGSYKPNAWGLFDLHGNVAEWCADWYGPYEPGEQTDPVGRADGYARVVRGWSYLRANQDPARYCRSANRAGHLPEDANPYTGFRVVLGETPKTKPLPPVQASYQKNVKQGPAPTEMPDSKKPYYVKYAIDGKNPKIAKDSWGPIFSQHNHYAAVCVCPNGDVLACWYTCVTEPGREMAQACSRLRSGADQWDEASLFFDVPDVNDHAPVLFSDGKRIFHFCTQSLFGWDNASNIVRWSDDNGVTWSQPKIMLTRDAPDRLSQPCSAFQAKDGTLVLACDGDVHVDERLMISKDRGMTWKVAKGDMRKAYGGKYVIHPAVVPTSDGAILSFLRGPHPMPVLISRDWGDTWEAKTTPFPGIGGGQKIAAMRLASGAILMCSQDNKKTIVDGGGTYAALSLDDGKTWPHVRKVEGVGGYMSVAQAPNGVIHLVGSRMGCAAFNEAWLREGKAVPNAERNEREFKAEAAIEEMGGRVFRDEKQFGSPVVNVDFADTNVTDADLRLLADFKDLRGLGLTDTKINGTGFAHLSALDKFDDLNFCGANLSDDGVKALAKLKGLRTLYLTLAQVGDVEMKAIGGLTRMRFLQLDGTNVGDVGMEEIAKLPELRILCLHHTKITDKGLRHLPALKQLKFLDLGNCEITDAGMKHVAQLNSLENLDLEGTRITGRGIQELAGLVHLQKLRLNWVRLSPKDLAPLVALHRLERLELESCGLTDDAFKEIGRFIRLKTLRLTGNPITGEKLNDLSALQNLESLSLQETKIADVNLRHLAVFQNLKSLNLDNVKISPAGLRDLRIALPKCEISNWSRR